MRLTLTATLAVAYGKAPTQASRNKKKIPAPLRSQIDPHPHRLDLKENQLSANVLAMQRQIRESKQQSRDAHAVSGIIEEPKDHAASSTSKLEKTADGNVRMSRKDHWEKLKLEEVQLRDLEAMDLTGLSSSLLAHPAGASMGYTERERKMVMALIEKKVSSWMETLE
jgi:hypothetical protein